MSNRLLLAALAVAVLSLALLAWGPLLVTSSDEALEKAQSVPAFEGVSYGEVVAAFENTEDKRGDWRVTRNKNYDSFFEGDREGFRWIVSYNAPGTDDRAELEFWVKRFTGDVVTREPSWSFLSDDQREAYYARDTE